jgi:hypothetical protein
MSALGFAESGGIIETDEVIGGCVVDPSGGMVC